MNKKILYAFIFTSIFIVSTVSVIAQPAAAAHWKLGIPEEAKGMEVESEVTVYDKDAWEEHVGPEHNDKVTEVYAGDSDEVGARSKTKVNDFEGEKIDFFSDFVMTMDVPLDENGQPLEIMGRSLTDYWSAVTTANSILREIAYRDEDALADDPPFANVTTVKPSLDLNASIGGAIDCGPIAQLEILTQLIWQLKNPAFPDVNPFDWGDPNHRAGAVATEAMNYDENSPMQICNWSDYLQWITEIGILSEEQSREKYNTEYSGTEIDIDYWDYVTDGDYDSNPDEDDWIRPILNDPHAYYDIYQKFIGYLGEQLGYADKIIEAIKHIKGIYQNCYPVPSLGPILGVNQTIFWYASHLAVDMALQGMYNLTDPDNADKLLLYNQALATGNLVTLYLDGLLDASGTNILQQYFDYPAGLNYIRHFIVDEVPMQKKEFLALLFEQGIYAMQPVDKYLEKIIDDFDIDDDAIWGDNFVTDGLVAMDALNRGGISVDGKEVTVEYDWVYLVYDTPDGIVQVEDEAMVPGLIEAGIIPAGAEPRKDYEIIYTYGDTGGQIAIEYKGSDTFFKVESIAPLIPGYEITILLASAAISAIALIYVVMKKKRM